MSSNVGGCEINKTSNVAQLREEFSKKKTPYTLPPIEQLEIYGRSNELGGSQASVTSTQSSAISPRSLRDRTSPLNSPKSKDTDLQIVMEGELKTLLTPRRGEEDMIDFDDSSTNKLQSLTHRKTRGSHTEDNENITENRQIDFEHFNEEDDEDPLLKDDKSLSQIACCQRIVNWCCKRKRS